MSKKKIKKKKKKKWPQTELRNQQSKVIFREELNGPEKDLL